MTQTMSRPTSRGVDEIQYRERAAQASRRHVPEEVPVAFSYGGSTHAVMMATPDDLEDFAMGFSLSEGIIKGAADILSLEAVDGCGGIDMQITLADPVAEALTARRRHMAGPVGCGLCGIESIEQAVRPVPDLGARRLELSAAQIAEATRALSAAQALNRLTHAVHGAGFFIPGQGVVAVREDVGRHNALDKLLGAVVRGGFDGARGAVVVTSRISVEMVQKTASLGSPILIAISAPTALAIDTADEAGITLVAIARGTEFEIFTHPARIVTGAVADVA